MTLQRKTNDVSIRRLVARAVQIALTHTGPHQERYWKVPDLNNG